MPLVKGHSREVIAKNIHEMVKAGHPVKQAIAASLAHAHASKKMFDGGEVGEPEQGNIGGGDDMADAGMAVYPKQEADDSLSDQVEKESKLVQGLQASRMKDNNNSKSYSAGSSEPTGKVNARGDLEEGDDAMPSEKDMPSVTSELLSEEMKKAIMDRKLKRMYI